MQNHYEIWSKYHLWTRNVADWSKSPDLVMSGPVQEDPYGPIRAHKGPYDPYGPQPGPGPNPDWAPTRARKAVIMYNFRVYPKRNMEDILGNALCSKVML